MGEATAPCIDAQIPITFSSGSMQGEGLLREVSISGGLVRDVTAPVSIGQKFTLELGLPSNLPSFLLAAEVVRLEEDGFAVRFFFDAPAHSALLLGLIQLLSCQREEAEAAEAAFRATLSEPSDQGARERPPRDRRSAPRLSPGPHPSVAGRVHFSCAGQRGRGTIHDISLTGAHVSEASLVPAPDEEVEMLFLMGANPRRIKALVRVVRRTPSGFAVRFLHLERELERLILGASPKADRGSR